RSVRALARRWPALATAILLALSACTGEGSGVGVQAIKVGHTLAALQELTRAVDAGSMRSLDPSISTDVPAAHVLDDLFEGLTRLDESGAPGPGMASSWQTSADGRTWTFHLREARWSNGDPIRAADFIYAWRRTVSPVTASENAQQLAPVVNAIAISEGRLPASELGISAPDERTVRVSLNAPTPYLLSLLSKAYTYPQYEPTVRAHGEDWVRPAYIVSNGAFVLREYVIGGRVTLAKNPRYWDAAHVRLQRVVYLPLDRTMQTSRFFAGELMFTDSFSAEQTSWLRQRLGAQVVSAPYLGNLVLGLNAQRPPFAGNRNLRMALTLGVDRETLVHYVRQGLYEPAWTPTPPLPGYHAPVPSWAQLSAAARHTLAQRYYAAAGYTREHPLRIELHYPTDTDNRRTYEAVAAMWRTNLGAQVETYNEEFRVQLIERHLKKLSLFHYSWIGDYPDPYTFLQLFQTGFGINDGGYSNQRYDALLSAAGNEADATRRLQLLAQAEAVLGEDVACIPLYYYATRHLIKPYVRGWTSNIQDRNLSQYMYLLEHQGQ
ncbi:MAG TPA: peptide ABC transporter substrate-binding protein, partial [Steroidobacteraceae bacterium]|nr:peptide ABC transporter substrate-binding protein [Steroidobacteraceae bacterium]